MMKRPDKKEEIKKEEEIEEQDDKIPTKLLSRLSKGEKPEVIF